MRARGSAMSSHSLPSGRASAACSIALIRVKNGGLGPLQSGHNDPRQLVTLRAAVTSPLWPPSNGVTQTRASRFGPAGVSVGPPLAALPLAAKGGVNRALRD